MAIAEKLQKKLEGMKEKMAEKSQKTEEGIGTKIDSGEWLLLLLISLFVDVLFIILIIVGAFPIVGQIVYAFAEPALNLIIMGIFWWYLQHKGLGHYWWLATGGWLVNLVPILNWIGWTIVIIILYFLTKAEKIPLADRAIEKAAKAVSKIK